MLAAHDLEPSLRQRLGSLRLAVVGHVEWAEFLRVPHLPTAGEITHVTDRWEAPAGGGAVTAVQLARLAGHAIFLTVLGDDEIGSRRQVAVLVALAVVEPTLQECVERHLRLPQCRECPGGGRQDLGAPGGTNGADIAGCEVHGVDVEIRPPEGIVAAWSHPVSDHGDRSFAAAVEVHDHPALWLTLAVDRLHVYTKAPQLIGRAMTELVVATERIAGGRWEASDGTRGHYDAVEPPGPVRDTYGCGDAFAGGLTAGLGAGLDVGAALDLAARCGAWVASLDGPYGRRPTALRGG